MGVVPAIIGSTVAGIAGSALSAGAASDAAQVQADAAKYSAQIQGQIYNQTRNDLSPFVRAGQGALTNYASLLPGGLNLPAYSPSTVFNDGTAGGAGASGPGGQVQVDGIGTVNLPTGTPGTGSGGTDSTAPPPFSLGPTGQSPFLSNVESYIPGSGVPQAASLTALNSLTPGGGSALGSAVDSFIPGSGVPTNALASSVANFVPGGSSTPDSSLSALRSLTPGGNSPLLGKVNGLLGLPTTADKQTQQQTVTDLYDRYNKALKGSGLSQDDFLASPQGKAFVTDRNSVISNLSDPELLAQFQSGAPDAAAAATQRLKDVAAEGAPGASNAAIQSALESTPGYRFTLDQGLKSTQNSFAAKGLANSGAALKGAAGFATGLANSTYEQRLSDYLNSYNSQYTNAQNSYTAQAGQALNTANTGFTNALNDYSTKYNAALNTTNSQFTNATNAYGQQVDTVGNLLTLGENAGAQTGAIGQKTGENVGNALTGGAAATAAGIVGSSNATVNAINSVGSNALTAALYSNGSAPGPKAADGWSTGAGQVAKGGIYGTG